MPLSAIAKTLTATGAGAIAAEPATAEAATAVYVHANVAASVIAVAEAATATGAGANVARSTFANARAITVTGAGANAAVVGAVAVADWTAVPAAAIMFLLANAAVHIAASGSAVPAAGPVTAATAISAGANAVAPAIARANTAMPACRFPGRLPCPANSSMKSSISFSCPRAQDQRVCPPHALCVPPAHAYALTYLKKLPAKKRIEPWINHPPLPEAAPEAAQFQRPCRLAPRPCRLARRPCRLPRLAK